MARVSHAVLFDNVVALLAASGVDRDKAQAVADVLVEADLIGHDTHGVGLLESYLDALASGRMRGSGDIKVVNDRGGCVTWDGQRAQVEDLGSTNGSKLDGQPLKKAILEPESVISIGRTRIVFRVLPQAAPPSRGRADDATRRHDVGNFWGPS